jgi:viroplasmin and RNaseH domain-containing protein
LLFFLGRFFTLGHADKKKMSTLTAREETQHSLFPYYAVKTGRVPGIYYNVQEARQQVKGIWGATWKGFKKFEDAINFIGRNTTQATSAMLRELDRRDPTTP